MSSIEGPASTPTLIAERLSRRFGDRVAVQDLSLELHGGEVFALLGPNGAGKTTTLRLLAGLLSPSSGAVSVDGERLEAASASRARSAIGLLTEAPGLWDRLTVRDNLLIYARLYSLPAPARAVEEALDLVGMRARAGDRAAHLSKGLKQRVALARALIHQPRIVLLDEPTAGLDPESARDVRELVRRLKDDRRAVLLSTHNLDEVQRVADRVAILRTRLVALDTPAALRGRLSRPAVRVVLANLPDDRPRVLHAAALDDARVHGGEVFVDLVGALTVPDVVRRLVDAGGLVESVLREEPPLEDVYLRLLEEPPQ